jgi:hypothetical protein
MTPRGRRRITSSNRVGCQGVTVRNFSFQASPLRAMLRTVYFWWGFKGYLLGNSLILGVGPAGLEPATKGL